MLTWGKGDREEIIEMAEWIFPPGLFGSPDELNLAERNN
jgi:hypothetical protein